MHIMIELWHFKNIKLELQFSDNSEKHFTKSIDKIDKQMSVL